MRSGNPAARRRGPQTIAGARSRCTRFLTGKHPSIHTAVGRGKRSGASRLIPVLNERAPNRGPTSRTPSIHLRTDPQLDSPTAALMGLAAEGPVGSAEHLNFAIRNDAAGPNIRVGVSLRQTAAVTRAAASLPPGRRSLRRYVTSRLPIVCTVGPACPRLHHGQITGSGNASRRAL